MLKPVSSTSSISLPCNTIKLLQFHLKGLRPEPVKKYETSYITQLPFPSFSSEELPFPAWFTLWLCGKGKIFITAFPGGHIHFKPPESLAPTQLFEKSHHFPQNNFA